MGDVHNEVVRVGHLTIERHALLVSRHLFHSAHPLVLREEDWQSIGTNVLEADHIVRLFRFGQQAFEGVAESILFFGGEVDGSLVFLDNQVLNDIGIDAYETERAFFVLAKFGFGIFGLAKIGFGVFLLELAHSVYIEFAIHEQDIVAFLFSTLDVGVVGVGILGVEHDQVAVLVRLGIFDFCLVLIECEIPVIHILHECETDSTVVELLVGEHTKLDEELDVIPLLLEVGAVVLVEFCQFVSHLLGDM